MNSMTGFGTARAKIGRYHLVVEGRSVNHRFCEVNFRGPGRFAIFENDIARRVRDRFGRGKFDLFLREESLDREDAEVQLAKRAHGVLKRIQRELGLKGPIGLSEILTCREIFFAHSNHEDLEPLRKPLLALFDKALEGLRRMREGEGAGLRAWFQGRLRYLSKLLKPMEAESRRRGGEYRQRLQEKWKAVGHMEEGRVLQESALMAERADVTEEIVRLKSHLKEFDRLLHAKEPVGRKLDFLAQEMGREINTIGSKSQGVRISHQVIEFKSELEKIREQVQNVE